MKLQIRQFDVTSLKPYRVIMIIGKRGTGKSFLLRDLLYNMRDMFDFGAGMSPTVESANSMEEIMPRSSVYQEFNQNAVCRMISYQKKKAMEKKELKHVFLILDDCMYDRSVLRSTAIRDLFMNGRHYHITFISAAQYAMDITPDLRTQIDYVFCLKENIMSNRIKLWKFFFGMFDKYADFAKVMDACTQDRMSLVLDNTGQSTNITDCVFWYKAKFRDNFTICKPKYWTLSDKKTISLEKELSNMSTNKTQKKDGVETVEVVQ